MRLGLKWSQPDFAQKLGITRERLASYEYAKAPVRYWLARTLGERFGVNQRWLATGTLPQSFYVDIDPLIEKEIPAKQLFSEAYNVVLMPHIEETLQRTAKILKCDLIDLDSDFGRERLMTAGPTAVGQRWLRIPVRYVLIRTIEDHLQMLPGELRAEYFEAIRNASESFLGKHEGEIIATWPEGEETEFPEIPDEDAKRQSPSRENKVLTNVSAIGNLPAVKSTMANLLDRLNKATSQRGMKSKLAKVMGVPLSNVSQWLSGEREPGGETTLRLLRWVEQQERKPEAPDSVRSTAKGKTQVRKSRNEKQT